MRQLSDFLLRLSRGALEKPANEFKNWALSEVACLIPFDSFVWGMGCSTVERNIVHSAHLFKLDSCFVESWLRFENEDRLVRDMALNSLKTFVINVNAEYSGTNLYTIHCKKYGVEHIIATGIIDPDTKLLNTLCIYRADADRPFSERERQFKEFIFPHLVEAARTNWLINLPSMFSSENHSIFNALAACDASGLLHVAMPSFVEVCRKEWADWTGPFLPKELIESLTEGHRDFIGENIVIRLVRLGDMFILRCRLKVLVDSLSKREIQIAQQVSEGNDYKTIAQVLSLSPSTVRTHVNNIFRKLGINDKAMIGDLLWQVSL